MKNRSISVIGGTGNLGFALAWRWARTGHKIIIGSRSLEKAEGAALKLNERLDSVVVSGMENANATAHTDIVVLTAPFAAHEATLLAIKTQLEGQILIDTTVPLVPPKVNVVKLPEAGSVALMTQAIVGDSARVVSAFHNVSASLLNQDTDIDCDILVTSDDAEARQVVIGLVEDLGLRGLNAGALANSAAAEAMTSLLIHMNKTYKVGHAGIQISGI